MSGTVLTRYINISKNEDEFDMTCPYNTDENSGKGKKNINYVNI